MNSEFEHQFVFDFSSKITDIKNPDYIVKIRPSYDLIDGFAEYAESYFNAAHGIAYFLICEDKVEISQLDTYIFPLAFLYRHAVELFLKGIAFQSIKDLKERKDFIMGTSHNLEKMLIELIKLNTCEYLPEESAIVWLQGYLKSISAIDKASDSFRYPFHVLEENNRFYIENVFDVQTHIDLEKFANKFETAVEILQHWYHRTVMATSEWKNFNTEFIETGGPYYGQSVVGYAYSSGKFFPYWDGYLEVARMLLNKMKVINDVDEREACGSLFLPMCFLYRNCVELGLKSLWIEEIRVGFQKKYRFLMKVRHNILRLWKGIREEISSLCKADCLDVVEKCCAELSNFDSDSDFFRYPCKKDLTVHFRQNKRFDFINVATLMESLIRAIDGIGSYLSDLNNNLNDYEYL